MSVKNNTKDANSGGSKSLVNILNSPLLCNISKNKLLQSKLSVSIWNVNGLKNNPNNPSKLDKIASTIEIHNSNPDLVLFSETHLDPKYLKSHPIPRLKSRYKYFHSSSSSSAKGGVSILSKFPLTIHYVHKSGNLIHFSIEDESNNPIPFIHCYASPSNPFKKTLVNTNSSNHKSTNKNNFNVKSNQSNDDIKVVKRTRNRRYYYRLILKRFNVIPDSIITGDLNTDIHNDNYFNELLMKPLCLSPDTDPSDCKPTFFPRGNGNPKHLDWMLLPASLSSLTSSTVLTRQTSPPISDHLLKTVTLKSISRSSNNSDRKSRKKFFPISSNLFEFQEVKEALCRASERLSSSNHDSMHVVEEYLTQSHQFMSILTKKQAIENKEVIREAKKLNESNESSQHLYQRMNEILYERTVSSRDRFRHFIANSRHTPGKAMSIMQKEKVTNKSITPDDFKKHIPYWKRLYKNEKPTSNVDSKATDTFTKYFNSHGKKLSSDAIQSVEKDVTVEEVSAAISSAPSKSSAGLDGISYEFFKLTHSSFHLHLTSVLNQYYSNPESLPSWIGTSAISLIHKKGDMKEPSNYRPISLLPTLWKLLSNILTQRLNPFISHIIRPEQTGFIKGRNIETAIHTIDSVIRQVPSAFTVAIDFEKAFDSVKHDWLKVVLNLFKFPPKFLSLIFKFLSLGKSCIKTNNCCSEFFSIERGVRQGDPLSGLLFVLAIEPLLLALHDEKVWFAPKIDKFRISHSAFADDLTIFIKNEKHFQRVKDLLDLFQHASGLKVNNKKTEVLHNTYNLQSTFCTWPIVRSIKILGVLFPIQSRLQINDTLDKLQGQISFWKRLKLPLYTKLILLTTYTKFQYHLSLLDWTAKDVSKVNKLIHWAFKNDNADFEPTKRYNSLFSATRCSASKQAIGFDFDLRLKKARLARVYRIMRTEWKDTPTIFLAQRLHLLNVENIFTFKNFPPTIKKHMMLWRREVIRIDPLDNSKPCSSMFHKLLNILEPELHPTPSNVPKLDNWPIIKKLHLPPSTKSFLLKVYMNALPTADRLAHTKDTVDSPLCLRCGKRQIHCPLCDKDLSSIHFFQGKCAQSYSSKILKWSEKHQLPKPFFSLIQKRNNSNYNLIYVNTLWKTVCKARHAEKSNVFSLSAHAKNMYKRELQIACILFPKEYKLIGKFNTSSIHDKFNFIGSSELIDLESVLDSNY